MNRTIIGLTLMGVALVATAWIRFANPDAAETRLFLEYWPLWIALAGLSLVGFFVANPWRRSKE
jgi:hypothetical protein